MKLLCILAATWHLTVSLADDCKCYPSDSCWPSDDEWDALNNKVHNRLQRVIPQGAACYGSYEGIRTRDFFRCKEVSEQWTNPNWVADQPALPMFPFWSNNTCQPPFGLLGLPGGCFPQCNRGLMAENVILAEEATDVQAGVDFARENNLRLVIRNTGHDLGGRSSGFGSLMINTHRFNSIEFLDRWTGPGDYEGGAVKAGAGVMVGDIYNAAWGRSPPLDVVGGECPTVGIAGGYTQGGGHSPLSGVYGLAADNALSFDVVLASGDVVTADADHYPDLFWALKGGGPGDYGVVVSVTVKTRPAIPVTGVSLTITDFGDRFWEGFRIWHTRAETYVSSGMYVVYTMTEGHFEAKPFVAPNMSIAEVKEIIDPLVAELEEAGVKYSLSEYQTFDKFGDLYRTMWTNVSHASGANTVAGGRLISLTDMKNHGADITNALRKMTQKLPLQLGFGGHVVNPGNAVADPDATISAVHPVWREAADVHLFLHVANNCNSEEARQNLLNLMTYELGDIMRAATPESAVYVNEGDVNEPNWQDAFWGPIYPRLLDVKKKYDPDGVFWTKSTPGSEEWTLQGETRLCRT